MSRKQRPIQAAAVYCRISLDSRGEGLGVKRQQELCEKLAAEKGWFVAEVYTDNDRSAYNGKPRPAYERMLSDLDAGRRDAVVCVDLDRLTRRPIELERFMELADRHGIALANVSGDTDLSSTDGRLKARIVGAVARQESEKKAERVSREAEQAAQRGVPRSSRRAFGYDDDRVTQRPDEAELIREAARRVLAGESVPNVCRDWNARGIPSPQGTKHGWAATSLVNILRSPRVAGLRTYKGEIVAELVRPDGATWEPILERAIWETLQGRIKRTARVGRPSTHLLSGIVRCGYCQGPMWTSWRHDKRKKSPSAIRVERYACIKRPGHAGCGICTVTASPVDEIVRRFVIERLSSRAFAAELRRGAGQDDEQERTSRELAAAEDRLEEIAADYAVGTLSRREWLVAREKVQERIARAARVLDRYSGALADLPRGEEALTEAWKKASIERRRELIRLAVDHVIVHPGKPTPRFDPSRVEIVPR